VAPVSPTSLHTDASQLTKHETLRGPQARDDAASYLVWQKQADDQAGPAGRYLVGPDGTAVWLVDPGINGTHTTRPDGSIVRKFNAPKATLMSYIIKGILDRKLPWALVLLGVMIAVMMEMSFLPALAFAVGVYLPLSSSSPIFFGGLVRRLVDRQTRKQATHAHLTEEQLVEESDKSPGVLLASGYIAGGAIAGIIIAFLAGALDRFDAALTDWSTAHNPFFDGPNSDALSMIPFAVLCVILYYVGREKLLSGKKT
jgi:OPT oligopeptide transporter protein